MYMTTHGTTAPRLFGNGGFLCLRRLRLLYVLLVSGVAQRIRRMRKGKHTVPVFLGRAFLTLASPFLTAALTCATLSACGFQGSSVTDAERMTKVSAGPASGSGEGGGGWGHPPARRQPTAAYLTHNTALLLRGSRLLRDTCGLGGGLLGGGLPLDSRGRVDLLEDARLGAASS